VATGNEKRVVPTLSALWETCAAIAVQLDGAEADWHALSEAAAELLPLADELELIVRQRLGRVRRAENALQALRASVEWVTEHQYQASEVELRRSLETALRQAMFTLDLIEQVGRDQHQTSAPLSLDRVRKPATDDTLEIKGLAGIVAADEGGERVDLTLGWQGHGYRVEMVRVTGAWLLRVRDAQGQTVTEANSSRLTLEAALGCAVLDVLWEHRETEHGASRRQREHQAAIKD
jgi:hypothetical protein